MKKSEVLVLVGPITLRRFFPEPAVYVLSHNKIYTLTTTPPNTKGLLTKSKLDLKQASTPASDTLVRVLDIKI